MIVTIHRHELKDVDNLIEILYYLLDNVDENATACSVTADNVSLNIR